MSKQNTMDAYFYFSLSLTSYYVGNAHDFITSLLLSGIPSHLTTPSAVLLH